jgi:hypothetical protein
MHIFNQLLVDQYEEANYFGFYAELGEEKVAKIREAWLGAMMRRGWICGITIISDKEQNNWSLYEADGNSALEEAHAHISRVIDVPTKAEFEAVDRYEDLRRETRGKANQQELLEKLVNSGSLSTEPVTSEMSWLDGAVMFLLIALVMLGGYLLR